MEFAVIYLHVVKAEAHQRAAVQKRAISVAGAVAPEFAAGKRYVGGSADLDFALKINQVIGTAARDAVEPTGAGLHRQARRTARDTAGTGRWFVRPVRSVVKSKRVI